MRQVEIMSTSNVPLVVVARNLRKQYGTLVAVDGIDFAIPQGCCFGLLGPNGAGKTTILRMILGLTPTSEGQLRVFDQPLPERVREVRARIGVVPQADNLDPDFTVAENLLVYGRYFGISRRELETRIERLLTFASLTERRDASIQALSGGMQRRLTIARALINNPELVVLDEPTTGLDPQARHLIWSRLNELREQGTTLLLTTHYMEEAERLCDELVVIDHGRILDQGSPQALVARHVEPEVIEIRAGADAKLQALATTSGCRLESMGRSLYCYTHTPQPLLTHLQTEAHGLTFLHRPTGLEDVFLRLTGRELRE
jgi:lipooligosaccharide transport system ATP-binding protein